LRSADVSNLMTHAKDFGLSAKKKRCGFDQPPVVKRSRASRSVSADGVRLPVQEKQDPGDLGRSRDRRARKITSNNRRPRREGRAGFPGSYLAKHIIVATGARPRVFPGLEPDKKLVWTYFEAMNPDKMRSPLSSVGRDRRGVRLVLPHARRRG